MYNRYIPQPDGSYRRRQVQDTSSRSHGPTEAKHAEPAPSVPSEAVVEHSIRNESVVPNSKHAKPQYTTQKRHRPLPQKSVPEIKGTALTDFFQKLFPKDFDTGDLLIVLLLLLMSGDSQEEQNSALLTLAIYMFL